MHTLQSFILSLLNSPLIQGLFFMLILAVITDLRARKIPNMLLLFGLIASLIGQTITPNGVGWLNWLTGVCVAFACFIPLYLLRAMAAGDVKLMMAVGGFLGYPLINTVVIYSYLAGGVIAICYVLVNGRVNLLMRNLYLMTFGRFIKTAHGRNVYDGQVIKQSAGRIPFALAIAIGTFITLISGVK
ncbi:MAG TPA: prepilin peptidase [Methylotenera sp.]|nr:prepilin peptidase [Methylotenera sp.]